MTKEIDTPLVGKTATMVPLLEMSEAERELAAYLEVDLTAEIGVLVHRAKDDARVGTEAALRMGLRLLALKSRCSHGEFEDCMVETGVGQRDAQGCMRLAKAYAAEGDARRREALLEMGKTKAVMLLSAIPEVREQIMDSPELLSDALEGSKREFEVQLAKLKKRVGDLELEHDNRESRKAIAGAKNVVVPDIPHEVTDIRREIAALFQQAELAVQSMGDLPPLIEEAATLPRADKWVKPTAAQAYTALKSLHAAIGLQMGVWREQFDLDADGLPPITNGAYYQPEEAALVAQHFEALTTAHLAEGIKRANRRANDTPEKRGAKRKDV